MTPARELLADDDSLVAIKRAVTQQLKKPRAPATPRRPTSSGASWPRLRPTGESPFDKYMTSYTPSGRACSTIFRRLAGFIRNTQAVYDRLKSSNGS